MANDPGPLFSLFTSFIGNQSVTEGYGDSAFN